MVPFGFLIIIQYPKGTIILTTTHVGFWGLPRICGRGFGLKFQGLGARVRKWSLGAVVDCFEW